METAYQTFNIKLKEKDIEKLKEIFHTTSSQKAIEFAVKQNIDDEYLFKKTEALQGIGGINPIYD